MNKNRKKNTHTHTHKQQNPVPTLKCLFETPVVSYQIKLFGSQSCEELSEICQSAFLESNIRFGWKHFNTIGGASGGKEKVQPTGSHHHTVAYFASRLRYSYKEMLFTFTALVQMARGKATLHSIGFFLKFL